MMEALIRIIRSKTINPKWTKILWQEIWWWWKKWNYDYKPAPLTKAIGNAGKTAQTVGVWKASNAAADDWED